MCGPDALAQAFAGVGSEPTMPPTEPLPRLGTSLTPPLPRWGEWDDDEDEDEEFAEYAEAFIN